MKSYELSFVVAGASVEDDELVIGLFDELDAMLAKTPMGHILTILHEGGDAVDAARHAVLACGRIAPQLRFVRLNRDLVGVSEIAARTGRTRQNVMQWIKAERHARLTAFPAPEGVVGQARVWLWSEVNTWLRQLELADEFCYPTRSEMADIDHMLSRHQLLTLERTPLGISFSTPTDASPAPQWRITKITPREGATIGDTSTVGIRDIRSRRGPRSTSTNIRVEASS